MVNALTNEAEISNCKKVLYIKLFFTIIHMEILFGGLK